MALPSMLLFQPLVAIRIVILIPFGTHNVMLQQEEELQLHLTIQKLALNLSILSRGEDRRWKNASFEYVLLLENRRRKGTPDSKRLRQRHIICEVSKKL